MAFCGQCGTKSMGGAFCTECGAAIGAQAHEQAESFIPTTYENKCSILAELWINYKEDERFTEFFEYNDLGLPIAYAVANDLVESNQKTELFVNETFELFLGALERDDEGFDELSEVLD